MALDELRRPLLLIALLCAIVVLIVEVGSAFLDANSAGGAATALATPQPGYAIPYLAAIDALVLYSLVLNTLALLSRELTGRLQGVVGLVLSLLGLLALIVMIFFAFQLLLLMVSLLLSPIFGTLAYVVVFGHFAKGAAATALGLILIVKVVLAACLVLAQPRYLQNKSLVALLLLSFGCTMLIAFLHAFPPGLLASITDAIGALVIAVLALIWALFLLVGSIIGIKNAA